MTTHPTQDATLETGPAAMPAALSLVEVSTMPQTAISKPRKPAAGEGMTLSEHRELNRLETVIAHNLQTFWEVGEALKNDPREAAVPRDAQDL